MENRQPANDQWTKVINRLNDGNASTPELIGLIADLVLVERKWHGHLMGSYHKRDMTELAEMARRFITDRGCTCNNATHRCATNQMLEDLEAFVAE